MNSLFMWSILLSVSPFTEIKGGIPLAIASGVGWFWAFIFSVGFSILMIPVVFLFLDYFHVRIHTNWRFYRRTFDAYVNRLRRKSEAKINKWHYFALWIFCGVPLPGTGFYTSVLISWLFNMNRKKSFFVIALGNICAGIFVILAVKGVIHIFT